MRKHSWYFVFLQYAERCSVSIFYKKLQPVISVRWENLLSKLTGTTPLWCSVMQLKGSVDRWLRASIVVHCTLSLPLWRKSTRGDTAPRRPNSKQFFPQLQQLAIADAKCSCRNSFSWSEIIANKSVQDLGNNHFVCNT